MIPAFYGLLLKQDANTQENIKSALLQNLKMLTTYKQNSFPFFGGDKMGRADIMLILFAARFPVLSHYRGFEIPEEEDYQDFQTRLSIGKHPLIIISKLPRSEGFPFLQSS